MSSSKLSWARRFIRLAHEVGTWSKDPSSKVGCVIVRDKRVLALGYNGFPVGHPDDKPSLADRDTKVALTVHAEMNAILNAAKEGVMLKGAEFYINRYPCLQCASAMVNTGAKKVHYLIDGDFERRWGDTRTLEVFSYANVRLNGYLAEGIFTDE